MQNKRKKEQNISYLVFMLILSILAIISLAVDVLFHLDDQTRQILAYADTALCFLFFIDFVILFVKAENKLKYMYTWGWLDLLSSIPMIEPLRLGRAIRIVRIFRVLRGIKSAKLIMKTILEKKAQSAVMTVVLIAIVLIVISSISILHFEVPADGNIKTAGDAVWWAIVTITTVGYGDKYPITPEGRIIAAILMVAGVGVFGTISGFVASLFLSPAKIEEKNEKTDIAMELAEIKKMILEIKEK